MSSKYANHPTENVDTGLQFHMDIEEFDQHSLPIHPQQSQVSRLLLEHDCNPGDSEFDNEFYDSQYEMDAHQRRLFQHAIHTLTDPTHRPSGIPCSF